MAHVLEVSPSVSSNKSLTFELHAYSVDASRGAIRDCILRACYVAMSKALLRARSYDTTPRGNPPQTSNPKSWNRLRESTLTCLSFQEGWRLFRSDVVGRKSVAILCHDPFSRSLRVCLQVNRQIDHV